MPRVNSFCQRRGRAGKGMRGRCWVDNPQTVANGKWEAEWGCSQIIYDKAMPWHCPHRLQHLCSLPMPPNRHTATDTPSARLHAAPLTPWTASPHAPTPVLPAPCEASGPRVGGHGWSGIRGAWARSGQSLEQRLPWASLGGQGEPPWAHGLGALWTSGREIRVPWGEGLCRQNEVGLQSGSHRIIQD